MFCRELNYSRSLANRLLAKPTFTLRLLKQLANRQCPASSSEGSS